MKYELGDVLQRVAAEGRRLSGVSVRVGRTAIPGFYEKGDVRFECEDDKVLACALENVRALAPDFKAFRIISQIVEGAEVWLCDRAGQRRFVGGVDVAPTSVDSAQGANTPSGFTPDRVTVEERRRAAAEAFTAWAMVRKGVADGVDERMVLMEEFVKLHPESAATLLVDLIEDREEHR